MYIEFKFYAKYPLADLAQAQLQYELRKWAHQHSIDYWSINTRTVDYLERVELPSTRAYELFCLTWNPSKDYWRKYRLIRN